MIRFQIQCGKVLEEYLLDYEVFAYNCLSDTLIKILRYNYLKLYNKIGQLILLLIAISIYIAPFRQAYRCSNFRNDSEDPQN